MARKDDKTGRLQPVIDYPFAEDGLDIWYAMRDWFGSYLAIYYTNDKQVSICLLSFPMFLLMLYFSYSCTSKEVRYCSML